MRKRKNKFSCKETVNKTLFERDVLKIVSSIREGKTMTYGEVAKLAGGPRASRAVGNILNKNYDSKIPCHRVIRADGKIGGYNRGSNRKRLMLKREGGCRHTPE